MGVFGISNCLSTHASSILTSIFTSGLTTWILTFYFKKLANLRSLIVFLGYVQLHLTLEKKTLEALKAELDKLPKEIDRSNVGLFCLMVENPTIKEFATDPLVPIHDFTKNFTACFGYYKKKEDEILTWVYDLVRNNMDYNNIFSLVEELSERIKDDKKNVRDLQQFTLNVVGMLNNEIYPRLNHTLLIVDIHKKTTDKLKSDIINRYSKWTTIWFFRKIKNWFCKKTNA